MKRFIVGLYENLVLRALALVLTVLLGAVVLTLGPVLVSLIGLLLNIIIIGLLTIAFVVIAVFIGYRLVLTLFQPMDKTRSEVLTFFGIVSKTVRPKKEEPVEVVIEQNPDRREEVQAIINEATKESGLL